MASENGEPSSSRGDNRETIPSDSALTKRAIEVREKLQDDTYSWIMQCLEMIFESFNEKDSRDIEIEKLADVVLNFCIQHLEHKKANDVFERLCHIYPARGARKKSPKDFNFTKEYDKLMAKEGKVKPEEARKHPKFIKFLDRVKELERGKQLSHTEALSID